MVTVDKAGANVLLSVLFDRGLADAGAGGGEDAGDFDPRPEPAGDAAASTDATPPASS